MFRFYCISISWYKRATYHSISYGLNLHLSVPKPSIFLLWTPYPSSNFLSWTCDTFFYIHYIPLPHMYIFAQSYFNYCQWQYISFHLPYGILWPTSLDRRWLCYFLTYVLLKLIIWNFSWTFHNCNTHMYFIGSGDFKVGITSCLSYVEYGIAEIIHLSVSIVVKPVLIHMWIYGSVHQINTVYACIYIYIYNINSSCFYVYFCFNNVADDSWLSISQIVWKVDTFTPLCMSFFGSELSLIRAHILSIYKHLVYFIWQIIRINMP